MTGKILLPFPPPQTRRHRDPDIVILLQFEDISNKVAKNAKLKSKFMVSKILRGRTHKIIHRHFHAPTVAHHMEKCDAIPPTDSDDKPKYTKFLASFRIKIAEKLLGRTHCRVGMH